jgi:hypothetical protein
LSIRDCFKATAAKPDGNWQNRTKPDGKTGRQNRTATGKTGRQLAKPDGKNIRKKVISVPQIKNSATRIE